MDKIFNLNLVLKHLLNGDLEKNLCRICFQPLPENCESIFTKICKEDRDYCIADVLEELCGFEFAEMDNYFVCTECFVNASNAYKFYLNTKSNNEILSFYVNELENNIDCIQIPETIVPDTICISLPEYTLNTPNFDYNLDGVPRQESMIVEVPPISIKKEIEEKPLIGDDDPVIIIKNEYGMQMLYTPHLKSLLRIKLEKTSPDEEQVEKKVRKKREPMLYRQCSRCPIKYRFIAKLQGHMRTEHGVILHVCKICQALIEDEDEYCLHLKTHTTIHQCEICQTIFHKRETMIAHLKWHTENNSMENHTCKICGEIASSEQELKDHNAMKHNKNYTCYYCGRMYKGQISFDKHIEEHEKYMELRHKNPDKQIQLKTTERQPKRFTCETCGRNFLGARALVWHNRLHTNERPFTCDVCGRGFVSENRRNQHSVCAHTVPTRRCPLCPALFHLRSMVNTHIKKVHLKCHKRRTRTVRHPPVYWDTAPVPIQELSVAIQNDILEMQADRELDRGIQIRLGGVSKQTSAMES